mmetsp:Transcript_18179/g.43772  ORF Transcript_18179/g.43772 Transcript_18179/m.43772 type:complete len:300 (-) Transcript_18179:511-1410(-)
MSSQLPDLCPVQSVADVLAVPLEEDAQLVAEIGDVSFVEAALEAYELIQPGGVERHVATGSPIPATQVRGKSRISTQLLRLMPRHVLRRAKEIRRGRLRRVLAKCIFGKDIHPGEILLHQGLDLGQPVGLRPVGPRVIVEPQRRGPRQVLQHPKASRVPHMGVAVGVDRMLGSEILGLRVAGLREEHSIVHYAVRKDSSSPGPHPSVDELDEIVPGPNGVENRVCVVCLLAARLLDDPIPIQKLVLLLGPCIDHRVLEQSRVGLVLLVVGLVGLPENLRGVVQGQLVGEELLAQGGLPG